MREVRVPKVGMSTIEVEIGRVEVAIGERVEPNSVLMSAEADKVDFDIEAGTSGIVSEILVAVGDVVPVGSVVALIENEDG